MGSNDIPPGGRRPDGEESARPIEEWRAGVTEHGDVVLAFTTDPESAPGAEPAQFICTSEDARAIAHMLLRTVAFAESGQNSAFNEFVNRISSPALRTVAQEWNAARGPKQMPAWDDLRLERLGPELGRIWGFDYDAATGSFTGRLAGSAIMTGFRKSFLGTPLRSLHNDQAFEYSQANFLQIVTQPACCRWSGQLFRMDDKIVEGERLILPMAEGGKTVGLLGASDYEGYPLTQTPAQAELIPGLADWCRL